MEAFLSSSDHDGSNTTLKERRMAWKLANETLREVSLSEGASFLGGLQRIQEVVLTSTYIIFGLELLHSFIVYIKAFEEMHVQVSGI